jgi:Tol biopolymer transport system component
MSRGRLAFAGIAVLALLLVGTGVIAKKPPKPPPDPPPAAEPAIAYADDGRLMIMGADGANPTVVFDTGDSWNLSKPDWSPDGSMLVFGYSGGGQGPGVYVINVDGTGLTKVVGTGSLVLGVAPVWSPAPVPGIGGDQYRIAYSDEVPAGLRDLFIVGIDGSDTVQLTDTPTYFESYPTWSPTAARVALDAWEGPNVQWGLYDFQAGTYTVRQHDGDLSGTEVSAPSWAKTAANEDKIAWWCQGDGDIWILDLDDLVNPQRFTSTGNIEERWPSWSPDDLSIVLKSSGSGKARKTTGYEVLSVDGSDRGKIGNGKGSPVWRR